MRGFTGVTNHGPYVGVGTSIRLGRFPFAGLLTILALPLILSVVAIKALKRRHPQYNWVRIAGAVFATVCVVGLFVPTAAQRATAGCHAISSTPGATMYRTGVDNNGISTLTAC